MHTVRVLDKHIGLVPAAIARTLGAIDTARGREDAFRMQRPQTLEALVDVARIQSTEASNAIEQVFAPRMRIEALVAQKATPRNRSEAEIAGYRAVLDLIQDNAPRIPYRPVRRRAASPGPLPVHDRPGESLDGDRLPYHRSPEHRRDARRWATLPAHAHNRTTGNALHRAARFCILGYRLGTLDSLGRRDPSRRPGVPLKLRA